MHEITEDSFPEEFQKAWAYAGRHLRDVAGPGLQWVRAWLTPPVAEHLAFHIGKTGCLP
jgi:hypothetical protein